MKRSGRVFFLSTAVFLDDSFELRQMQVRGPRVLAVDVVTGRHRKVMTSEAVLSQDVSWYEAHFPEILTWWHSRGLYFHPLHGLLNTVPYEDVPLFTVQLAKKTLRRGSRWLMICPYCQRLVTQVAAVRTTSRHEMGCRSCLGLAYPSQTRHRTQKGDRAVLSLIPKHQLSVVQRANEREEGRFERVYLPIQAELGLPCDLTADFETIQHHFSLQNLQRKAQSSISQQKKLAPAAPSSS